MQKKQFAVIDVGSSKITAAVGERGVNKTFVIKERKDFVYEGFSDAQFFDVDSVKSILFSAAQFINSGAKSDFTTVIVGVPGEFTEITVKDSQISFPGKKRIEEADVDKLFDAAFVQNTASNPLINRSAVVYELNDYRRLADPIGAFSEILKGKLSFITCSNYFIETVKNTLVAAGIKTVECVSTALAEVLYLLDPEIRDRIAVLIDVGYITTTLSLIQGDGILFQKSFGFGGGYITAAISQSLDLDFETAEELKRKVNLSVKNGETEIIQLKDGRYFSAEATRKVIKESLDVFCGNVSDSLADSGYIIPDYVPLTITGGGISYMRGAKEWVSDRLGCAVEVVAPPVPLMDEPTESSLLSLLDLAISSNGE